MEFIWYIVQGCLGIIVGFIAFFAKMIHRQVEKNTEELAMFKIHVAANHPTHDGINRRFDKVDEKLTKIDEKLDDKIDKISTKIDNIFSARRRDDS